MADQMVAGACAVIVSVVVSRARRRRRNRRIWTREWIQARSRYGAYHQLLQELRLGDELSYRHFLRMDAEAFDELLTMVRPHITYQDTNMRESISPGERLAVTLRFLATGETYSSLQYLYRIPAQTLGRIIPDTCAAIVIELQKFIKVPKTESEWLSMAESFNNQWNFPHCLGAMDGKHIVVHPPPNSGSYFFNYKHSFSIVLLALVDANYRFLYIDVGCNGRISDGGVYRNSELSDAIKNNSLHFPRPQPLQDETFSLPYMIVSDDAFPLQTNIMKPYSQAGLTTEKRIYNYRLSRARRIVENAFGILANRFRVFMSPIGLDPTKVETIVLACCSMHNFLSIRSSHVYSPQGITDTEHPDTHVVTPGEWRQQQATQGLVPLARQSGNRPTNAAKEIREYLCTYFNSSNGSVPWQNNMI